MNEQPQQGEDKEARLREIEARWGFAVEDLAQLYPGWSVRESIEASLTDFYDLLSELRATLGELADARDELVDAAIHVSMLYEAIKPCVICEDKIDEQDEWGIDTNFGPYHRECKRNLR